MPSAPPLEFGVTGFYPAFAGAALAQASEAMGFDIHAFPENHSQVADAFGEMRDAARATASIRLLGGPINFLTRDPGVVAAAIIPVQMLSGGRAICGVASGDSAVAAAGKTPQPVRDLERDLTILQKYLRGEAVQFASQSTRIDWAVAHSHFTVPIQMACSGPRAIALAAKVADRLCLGIGAHPERLAWALDIIDASLSATGRERSSLRIGMNLPLAVAPDRKAGLAKVRLRVAGAAHMSSFKGIDLASQPEILRRVTTVLRDGYDYRYHKFDIPADNPNSAVCDEEFADWMGIGGPPSYVTDRIAQLVEMGVDYFMIPIPLAEREVFAAEVIPPLRSMRR